MTHLNTKKKMSYNIRDRRRPIPVCLSAHFGFMIYTKVIVRQWIVDGRIWACAGWFWSTLIVFVASFSIRSVWYNECPYTLYWCAFTVRNCQSEDTVWHCGFTKKNILTTPGYRLYKLHFRMESLIFIFIGLEPRDVKRCLLGKRLLQRYR